MPVPTDPYNFSNGSVADGDQVDARFAPLYAALAGALDRTNMVPGGLAPEVTSLPLTPVDQQECVFIADAANGIKWHLRYRLASTSAYKWEPVNGAAELTASIDTAESVTSAGFANPATVGPDVTVPLAGDYEVFWECQVESGAGGVVDALAGVNPAGAGPPLALQAFATLQGVNQHVVLSKSRKVTAVTAASLFRLQYASSPAQAMVFSSRRLRVRPVRVG